MSYFVCDSCDKRHEIFSNGGAKKMAEELSLPVLGEIPLVANMRQAADDGEPWFIKQERHPAKDQFLNICHEIVAQLCNRVIEGKVAKNVQQNAIPQPKPADEKKRRLPVL